MLVRGAWELGSRVHFTVPQELAPAFLGGSGLRGGVELLPQQPGVQTASAMCVMFRILQHSDDASVLPKSQELQV